jgi:hypothetical protein
MDMGTSDSSFLNYKKPKLKERYREKYARYLELDAFKAIAEKPVPPENHIRA